MCHSAARERLCSLPAHFSRPLACMTRPFTTSHKPPPASPCRVCSPASAGGKSCVSDASPTLGAGFRLSELQSLKSNAHAMDDDPGLDREKQALSFNPFGDSFLPSDGNHNTVDSTRDREETEQARIQLENLQIPTGNEARTGSNASSAISGHTNPLFDALDAKPGPPPGSPKPTVVASFLNPAAESYAPGSPAASSMHKVPSSSSSMSAGVSINMGAGTGPRRHRLSSASSVKSTRSRRSTSSSFSSLGSKVQQDVDPDVTLSKVSETAVAASALSGTPPPPPTARPGMRQTHSQESTLSLQPSVMSLETVARTPPPVAGYRIPATGSLRHASFPQLNMCGPAFRDLDQHPIYVCSAILGTAIHPAKAGPHLSPPVRMSFAGKEILHEGRFDLLPITTE